MAFRYLTFYSSGTISFFVIRILFLKWKKAAAAKSDFFKSLEQEIIDNKAGK